jgi:7-carboxy-7-deazaguanine synthase
VGAAVGWIREVFASFQGEGSHVGRRTIFVRTAGCRLRCRFCDTPEALVRTPAADLERPGAEGTVETRPNPLAAATVAAAVAELDPEARAWVSFTGGEPLEQVEFLLALAPLLKPRPLHLETAGVDAPEMRRLRPLVDFVCFDLKLDSVAHEGDRSGEHRDFLAASRGGAREAKVVLGAATDLAELARMCDLVREEDPALPLVLQPETPADGSPPRLPRALLDAAARVASERLRDVRVVPQTHRFLGIA